MRPVYTRLSAIEAVIAGPDCTQQQVRSLVERAGASRAFVVSTPSLTRTPHLDNLQAWLGDRFAGRFVESVAHTPQSVVRKATESARSAEADILISFGGSSVVDLTKGVALTLAEGDDYDALRISYTPERGAVVPKLSRAKLPHIAIPTTLSAAEYTSGAGLTDDATREKQMFVDRRLTPRWILQDPTLCDATPRGLWLATGVKILADCIELVCSRRAQPLTDGLAMKGGDLLFRNLTASGDPANLTARGACLSAGFLALGFAHNASVGLVAALRHQLGAGLDVSHGEASAVVLPHVLRWNLAAAERPLADFARFLGVATGDDPVTAATGFVTAIERLIGELGIPTRLRDVGADRSALRDIAEHCLADVAIANNPRPVRDADELTEILEAAY